MTDTTAATTPKKPIPAQKFDLELVSGSAKAAANAAGATKADMLNVDPAHLHEIPGFNVRVETPDYLAHIEDLAQSMVANGFYPNKPVAAYVAKDEDGTRFMLTDGYTRLRAVTRARELGAEIATIPVVVKSQTQTVEDLTVALVQDNEGRPLNPFERAIVVKRLEGFGWDDATIASRLGITTRFVSDLKVLAGAPAKVRDLVVRGKVSGTEAIKSLRKDGAKAGDTLSAAVKDAEAKGKTKATGKDVKNVKAAAEPKTVKFGRTITAREVGGKQHTTIAYNYKQGQIVETVEMKAAWLFNDADWWDYVDEKSKEHVVINEDISISVTIVTALKDESGAPVVGDAAVDETFGITDQSEGGEGESEDGPSIDHAAGGDDAEAPVADPAEDNGGL